MAHGAGGRAMAQLIEVFARHLGNEWLAQGDDGAVAPTGDAFRARPSGHGHRQSRRLAPVLPRRRHRRLSVLAPSTTWR